MSVLTNVQNALAALTTGCAVFSAAWKNARATDPLNGRWQGEWRSGASGHHGPLRCVLVRQGQQEARALFHARYWKCLRVCYAVNLRLAPIGNGWSVEGQTDLGRLAGGVYHYEGSIVKGRFLCTYRCDHDAGEFFLTALDGMDQSAQPG